MPAAGGMASAINPSTLGPGNASSIVNGQLVTAARSGNWYPRPLALAGPGGISSGITNPGIVPQSAGPLFAGSAAGSSSVVQANQAAANPFSFLKSPIPLLIGAVIVVALMMHFVHHGV